MAQIRTLTNAIEEFEPRGAFDALALREALETTAKLLGPMMPHLAEEIWRLLGHDSLLCDQPWPVADAALVVDDTVTMAVQVNGKLRGTVEVARDAADAVVTEQALALPNVQAAMGGKPARKVIVVRNRIVNVVV